MPVEQLWRSQLNWPSNHRTSARFQCKQERSKLYGIGLVHSHHNFEWIFSNFGCNSTVSRYLCVNSTLFFIKKKTWTNKVRNIEFYDGSHY